MRRNPAKALEILTGMLEFFDGGRRWTRNRLYDPASQNRCLIGALHYVRRQQSIRGAGTDYYLYASLMGKMRVTRNLILSMLDEIDHPFYPTDRDLMGYNDGCDCYGEVRELIIDACAWAQAELDATRELRRNTALIQPNAEFHNALKQIEGEEACTADITFA